MRNLKRALSLALAAVMVLGLMIVGAGAVGVDDFTDADEITNREAVSVLTSLGVITGKDDGSYDPSGTITRAEMTTIICRILNGGTDPQLGSSVTNTFSDTVNHWASGYIEFCVTRGIVAGRGDGTFDPDGTVTVAEGAKMMLVALGYNASVEGLTGSNWQINTDVLANQKGLYEGMEMANTSENLSRDNAAQMGYNLLDLNMISYDYIISTDGNVVSTTPQVNDDNDTVLEELFNAVRVEGVVTGNEMAVLTSSGSGSHLDAERTRINVTNYGDGDGEQTAFANGSLTLVATTGLEELGRSVNVFVRASSSSSRATIIGSVIVSEDNTVVTDYSGDTIAAVADDNNLNLVSGTQTALNYADVADYSASVEGNGVRGVEKILIDNDGDSDLDYVLLNTYRFGKVTSYVTSGDGSITVNCGSSNTWSADDADDVVGFEDVARDNYVIAAQIGGRLHVELAETVTGTLDGYRESTGSTSELSSDSYSNRLSVDGTNYNVAWLTGYIGGTDNINPAYSYGENNLDTEATFFLGKGDYVVAVGDIEANAYNYTLVLAKDSGINNQVKVALSDGTIATYTLSSSGSNVAFGDVEVGEVYAYTLSGTSNIRLNAPVRQAADKESTGVSFTKGRTSIAVDGSTYYATSSTVFFYVNGTSAAVSSIDNGDVDVYAGYANAPTLSTTATKYASVYTRSNDSASSAYNTAAVVVFRGTGIASANVDDFLYVYGKGNSTSDYTDVNAFVAGSSEAQDVQVDGAYSGSEGVHLWSVNSDGYYELDTPTEYDGSIGNLITGTFTNGVSDWTVRSSNSDTFVITDGTNPGTYELAITGDTMLVNDSDYLSDPTAELGAGPEEGDNIAYVLFTLDNGQPDEAKLVVIKNSTSDSNNDNVSTDVQVIASSVANDYTAPLFYRESGTAITSGEMRTALTNKMIADGCTDITFNGYTSVTYTKGGSTVTETFIDNGSGAAGLSTANNQAYKVTLNGTAGYYIAGTTFLNTSSTGVDLSGTYCYINGSSTETATTTGHTVTAGDTDTTIVDGYINVASLTGQSATSTDADTAGLDSATVTYSVSESGIVKVSNITITVTSDTQPTDSVRVTVSGTGIDTTASANVVTVPVNDFVASNSSYVATIRVPVTGADNITSLTVTLDDPTD